MWRKKEEIVMICSFCQVEIKETDHVGITPIHSVVIYFVMLGQCLENILLMRVHLGIDWLRLVFFKLSVINKQTTLRYLLSQGQTYDSTLNRMKTILSLI